MIHRLTLTPAATGPGAQPTCSCGWAGLPRCRSKAEAEYRLHRRQQEQRHSYEDRMTPHELTPADQLPDELVRAYHKCDTVISPRTEDEV